MQKLGFDVLMDIVDHSYDPLFEANNKVKKFVESAENTIQRLKSLPLKVVAARCQQAAYTNQKVLARMAAQWPSEFEHWLQNLSQQI
jgi:hypothetical protein